jgi:hypothetical protein
MARIANAPEPEAPTKFGDLLKDTLAIKPISEGVHTSEAYGESEYTEARVIRVDAATGEWENLGPMWIFAQRVRAQLRNAEDGGWVAGVLTRTGNAYQLEPVPAKQLPMVEAALDAFEDLEEF